MPSTSSLTKKKCKRLIRAVIKDKVNLVKSLPESPDMLFSVIDKEGRSLLQLAIYHGSSLVFDYLVSIEDFPLEMRDFQGETALETVLRKRYWRDQNPMLQDDLLHYDYFFTNYLSTTSENFALRLIERGADIDHSMLLHCAIKLDFVNVARMLLDRGFDVNEKDDYDNTPLHVCFLNKFGRTNIELVLMLLCSGADPFLPDYRGYIPFASALMMLKECGGDPLIRPYANKYEDVLFLCETLFRYTFDEHGQYEIPFYSYLIACEWEISLISQIMDKFSSQVTFFACEKTNKHIVPHFLQLDWKYVKVLIEKFPIAIKEMILTGDDDDNINNDRFCSTCSGLWEEYWDIFDKFINSELKSEVITYISNLNCRKLLIGARKISEDFLTEQICYLLSYGIRLDDYCLDEIYNRFGYDSELFQICLHMDVDYRLGPRWVSLDDSLTARLIYDIRLDIHSIIPGHRLCSNAVVIDLLSHCALPELKAACSKFYGNKPLVMEKLRRLPQVPLLVELARNAFRQNLVKCGMRTTKQFHDLLSWLGIPRVIKKIIAYEKPLYP